ncbi:hypothetical protein [Herbidospora sp. RD11066]
MRITLLLGLALALAACGVGEPSDTPGRDPARDPVNSAACLEFGFAAGDLREAARRLRTGDAGQALEPALRHMDRAVQAANGEVEPVMDDAVLAAEALLAAVTAEREADAEAAALASVLGLVEGACRRAGTPIEVPFTDGEPSGSGPPPPRESPL